VQVATVRACVALNALQKWQLSETKISRSTTVICMHRRRPRHLTTNRRVISGRLRRMRCAPFPTTRPIQFPVRRLTTAPYYELSLISTRRLVTLRSPYGMGSPSVSRLSVCLPSAMLLRPTHRVKLFRNISAPSSSPIRLGQFVLKVWKKFKKVLGNGAS